MTTSPVATRNPANARFTTEDIAGAQQTLGIIRAGWPVEVRQSGAGTATDTVQWDAQAAVVLDAAVRITKDPLAPQLDGGTLLLEVNLSGQTAYNGTDGWVAVVPAIEWPTGSDPLFLSGVLGKAHLLTKAGDQGSRIRVTVSGPDWVEVVALVAPVVANPLCPSNP